MHHSVRKEEERKEEEQVDGTEGESKGEKTGR